MKTLFTIFSLAVVLMLISFTYTQDTKGLGRVQKLMGKEIYIMSEPLRDYDIVETFSTELGSALLGRQTIDKQMENVIVSANKRIEKGKLQGPYDALMTADGDKITLIKWK
jgi:hypothetical protein